MTPRPGSEEEDIMEEIPCRELISTLLWVSNGTRPDISYAVSTLAKYTTCYIGRHYLECLSICMLLKSIVLSMLVMGQ